MLVDKFCQKKTIATLDNKTNELNRIDFLYFMLPCFRQKYIQKYITPNKYVCLFSNNHKKTKATTKQNKLYLMSITKPRKR